MKYIGPFLRMNSLNLKNLENQLFFFAKESLKHIVLKSRCGVTISPKNFKKSFPNNDINIIKDFSPLLCVYKKANPKVIKDKEYSYWDSSTFKKEIVPSSCAFMTLSIMELINYYEGFKGIDDSMYQLSHLYKNLAKYQLDFYTSYLRNTDGVFIIKKNISEDSSDELKFEEKESKFKFSDQALMMTAFLKYSLLEDGKDKEAYKSFSQDILNMLLHFKDSLYDLSFEELNKIVFSLNISYCYEENPQVVNFIIDLIELLKSRYEESMVLQEKIDHSSLFRINLMLSAKLCSLEHFSDISKVIRDSLLELYEKEKGIILKKSIKKEIKYSSEDLIFFILSMLIDNEDDDDKYISEIITDVYRHQIVNSKILTSWPESPSLDSPERYLGFTRSSKHLMDEKNFKISTLDSPRDNEYSSVFLKSLEYNTRKETFTPSKISFDSTKNMNLIFIIIFLLKDKVYDNYSITEE
ncbi:hypothetical protein [Clostridium polynesiense]|uniref:hypothetical protein n=1 Tax=Clostridium polynesiense TaxID=1325933 RepID=UPI00058DEF70|nr:hypothetical protein [Clostridium polynesiense]